MRSKTLLPLSILLLAALVACSPAGTDERAASATGEAAPATGEEAANSDEFPPGEPVMWPKVCSTDSASV